MARPLATGHLFSAAADLVADAFIRVRELGTGPRLSPLGQSYGRDASSRQARVTRRVFLTDPTQSEAIGAAGLTRRCPDRGEPQTAKWDSSCFSARRLGGQRRVRRSFRSDRRRSRESMGSALASPRGGEGWIFFIRTSRMTRNGRRGHGGRRRCLDLGRHASIGDLTRMARHWGPLDRLQGLGLQGSVASAEEARMSRIDMERTP